MKRIHILDKAVAELIAAGEVVERPASIVKELIENSIDAGATSVTVEIKNGGVSYIRIADNGSGIVSEDIPKAFLRHATSKVRRADDLDSILTLGFRGEALASISAVSKVELTTRTAEDEEGCVYRIEGGEFVESAPAGCPPGTTIVVRDVFFNTPARQKFLKRDVAEGNSVALVVEKSAMSHPEVAHRFIRDGQVKLRTSGGGDLRAVLYSVYGREFANDLLEVDYTFDGLHVSGYVARPAGARPSRVYQNFFINGRYVRTRTCSAALEEAFKTKLMAGKFPACALNLRVDAGTVDVNVHPAKIEVRFVNEKPVFNAVYFAVKGALSSLEQPVVRLEETPAPPRRGEVTPLTLHQPAGEPVQQHLTAREFRLLFDEEAEPPSFSKPMALRSPSLDIYVDDPAPGGVERSAPAGNNSESAPFLQKKERAPVILEKEPEMESTPPRPPETPPGAAQPQEAPAPQEKSYRVIGQLFDTYILLEDGAELLLVDKHAAHERLQYERLKENLSYGNRQVLLSPLRVSLSQEEYTAVLEHPESLAAMGFGVEDFGGALLVREVPVELGEGDIPFVIGEIAGKLRDNRRDLTPEALDRLYYSIACKSAIRAGDKNHPSELEELVRRLAENPQITHCPHGRPVSIRLGRNEIEKMFGRLG